MCSCRSTGCCRGSPVYTAREVAELAGLPLEYLLAARQATGLALPDPDEKAYSDQDLETAPADRGAARGRDPGRRPARDHARAGPQPRAGRRGDPLRGGGRLHRERHHRARARAPQRGGRQHLLAEAGAAAPEHPAAAPARPRAQPGAQPGGAGRRRGTQHEPRVRGVRRPGRLHAPRRAGRDR